MTDHALMIAAADAMREAAGARARFPGNRLNHLATIEEVGEHAQALLEHSRGTVTAEAVYAEAIQCAAMYLRLATEGTAEVPYEFSPALSAAFKPTTPKTPALPVEGIRPNPGVLSDIRIGDIVAAPARRSDLPYHGLTPPPADNPLFRELTFVAVEPDKPVTYTPVFGGYGDIRDPRAERDYCGPSAGNEV